MQPEPVRVELVGLFPEFYRMCPKGVDYMNSCGLEPESEQLRDYPPDIQEMGQMLQDTYHRLMAEFGGRVMPTSVGVASLRGLWLSLRHRLDSRRVWVIAGGRAVPVTAGYEQVRSAVAAALHG